MVPDSDIQHKLWRLPGTSTKNTRVKHIKLIYDTIWEEIDDKKLLICHVSLLYPTRGVSIVFVDGFYLLLVKDKYS